MRPDAGTRAVLTRLPESWVWMAPDLLGRLLPFAAVAAVVEIVWRPPWLGFSAGRLSAQLVFAAVAAPVLFVAATFVQLLLPPPPGALSVPARGPGPAFPARSYVLHG